MFFIASNPNAGIMDNFYKYIFVSHSSRDWKKVRTIRNYLEKLNFFPLLFHLKCLEREPLLAKDKKKLYELLSEEIASRGRFLLCNSKNSMQSEFVLWENVEVKKHSNILVNEIDLEVPMSILKSQIKCWITKLNTIAFVGTHISSKLRIFLEAKLKALDKDLKFIYFVDDEHVPIWNGCISSDAINFIKKECEKLNDASLVVLLKTNDYTNRGFCSRAEYFIENRKDCVVIPIYLENTTIDSICMQKTLDEILSYLYK